MTPQMLTVEMLYQMLALAESMGYGIRHEWLGGQRGGICEFSGRKWLFVDLALNPVEQLEQVTEALRQDPRIHLVDLPYALREPLGVRRCA
jgi:hypothetical protein